MKSIEVAGKTLDAAKSAALEQLGVAEGEVQFEVLKKPGAVAGLLGGGEYLVKATLMQSQDGRPDETVQQEEGSDLTDQPESEPDGDQDARLQQIAERALQVTADLIELMGVENGQVKLVDISDREIALEISTDSPGMLIGRHGETLDALQLVVAIGANKGLREGARIILDTEDYRQRHVEMLENMARSYAAKAKDKGQEVVIEGLKAYERRIVHMTLRDDPDVGTYSEGEGNDRILVISPAVN